jgi:hypothetical protein
MLFNFQGAAAVLPDSFYIIPQRKAGVNHFFTVFFSFFAIEKPPL